MSPFESWLIVFGICFVLAFFAFTVDIIVDLVATIMWKAIIWRNRRK